MFDLVIIDEGHNLKHGFGDNVSARNRVLGLAMGHPDSHANPKLFAGFGPRALRVLFLSATPVEETYRHLWNQLEVFGRSAPYRELLSKELDDDTKKGIAGRFLIRRVTSIWVGGEEYTKNNYRREWRRGGVSVHDEPIHITDARQRLVVGLVQKKVSELLGHTRFNRSFQIGMLASFESFLETTKLKRDDQDAGNFDDPEQTSAIDDILVREGVDVGSVNRLATSYRHHFDREMPHPKMDTVVDALARCWTRGEKALVFVRRVASVKELKRKLDERYDDWLTGRLRRELPDTVQPRLEEVLGRYRAEKKDTLRRGSDGASGGIGSSEADQGGNDTFFAWFFRGEGPRGVVSGANIQQRFIQRGAVYATFFVDNYVSELLGCRPGDVQAALSAALGVTSEQLRSQLRHRSRRFLSGRAKKHAAADRYDAVQAAAVEWLKECPGPHQAMARVVWHERFQNTCSIPHATEATDIGGWLELSTFFTELRQRPALRERLWPPSTARDPVESFREQELRAQMLASAVRLGHGLIDLYVMTIRRLNSMELRVQEAETDEPADRLTSAVHEYLDLLEQQMATPIGEREWSAVDELSEIAANFHLILDVNEPEARQQPIAETARVFGQLLGRQQPIGGMSGQVNQTLIRQFRMPGYPLVLVTTDLLQEGEDLHTFCSSVSHYGISWTPSAMEQRIGRVDRVRSQTDRRLSTITQGPLSGEHKLQVYFPHLQDTVEVLQVRRVLERMNVFLRLMHEDLLTAGREERTISTEKEFARACKDVPQILERLRSAFPVTDDQLRGDIRELVVKPDFAFDLAKRFARIRCSQFSCVNVTWEPSSPLGILLGTARLGNRVQPFTLLLRSLGDAPLIRCISPVGCVSPRDEQDSLVSATARPPAVKIGVIETNDECTYDLTVEGDVLLASDAATDAERIGMLIKRVVQQADALEQEFCDERDGNLETFRSELLEEGNHGR